MPTDPRRRLPPSAPLEPLQRAIESVGHTQAERARWLLNDLKRPQPYQTQHADVRIRLRYEWGVFLNKDRVRSWIDGGGVPLVSLPDRDVIDCCWRELKGKVELLANGEPCALDVNGHRAWSIRDRRLRAKTEFDTYSTGAKIPSRYNHYVGAALDTLTEVGDRFRFCRECNSPFIRTGKQRYCSPTCRGTFNTRTYRQRCKQRAQSDNP
jgi:hypothetical protein